MRTPGPAAVGLSSNLEATLCGRPRLVRLFLDRRMACPGCPMARFETLADAARHHGVDGEELLAAVRRALAPPRRGGGGRPGGVAGTTPAGGAAGGPKRQSGRGPAPPTRRRPRTP